MVLFSSVRKAHIFLLGKGEKRVLFLYGQEKNEKKPQASGLTVGVSQKCIPSAPDTCLRTAGVRKPRRNTPNGQRVRSGSFAPAGAGFPDARTCRTGSGGLCEPREHCNTFRAVCTCFPAEAWEFEAKPQQLFWYLFSLRRKVHIFSFVKERNVSFSCTNKKRTKRSRERSVRSSVRPAAVRWRL